MAHPAIMPAKWHSKMLHTARAFGSAAYPPSTMCVGFEGNTTDWCINNCLPAGISHGIREACDNSCSCHTWDRVTTDAILGSCGAISFLCCVVVLAFDLTGSARTRLTPTMNACLRWSNMCNLFYSLYFVAFAYADSWKPLREPVGPADICADAWAGLVGQASCSQDQDGNPWCFLNCCVFAAQWLQFFGCGSLLWNIMWLIDVARYTFQPLRPEKIYGIPVVYIYHTFTWAWICWATFAGRLTNNACRHSSVDMLPCTLRRGNIRQAWPVVLLLGFLIGIGALIIILLRYMAAGRGAMRSSPQSYRLRNSMQRFLRKQCRHTGFLAFAWTLILVDGLTTCSESVSSYITACGFAGLGCFLAMDRLLTFITEKCYPHRLCKCLGLSRCFGKSHSASPRITVQSPDYVLPSSSCFSNNNESQTFRSSADSLEDPLAALALSSTADDCYHLMDFDSLLARIVDYLREELAVEGELSAAINGLSSSARLAWLRGAASRDDGNHEADWRMASHGISSSDYSLRVVAPRTFAYLRCVWGVDVEHFIKELLHTLSSLQASSLGAAGKSGSALLTSVDGQTFVMKTITEPEVKQLRTWLPAYRQHVTDNPNSFLCRIYGCFSFKNSFGSRLNAVLMECLSAPPAGLMPSMSSSVSTNFDDMAPKAQRIDMKSAFQDGGFGKSFPDGLQFVDPDGHVSDLCREKVCGPTGLEGDYAFLAKVGAVDYSLLLTYWEVTPESCTVGVENERCFLVKDACAKRAPGQIFARLGVIDFLQDFNKKKWTESALKRALVHPLHGAERVTIVDPQKYASRQLEFVQSHVFPETGQKAMCLSLEC